MDRDVWRIVSAAVRRHARAVGEPGRRPTYPTRLIVLMYLWGAYFDRCMGWARDRRHYGGCFRPRGRLPSVSQFTRRVRAPACREVLRRVHADLRRCGVASDVGYFDGKPLPVGPASKDPDAARGRAAGGWAKGYKLHAYVNERRRVVVWSVAPLNVAEQSVALVLAGHLPPAAPGAVDLADGNYDAAPLHRALNARGRALLTPLKGRARVGPAGRHPVTLRQMGPGRREAVRLWDEAPGLARMTLRRRNNVEGVFSVLAAGGLGALPPHVRRLDRVTRHVGAKIILYHARLLAQERAAA